MPRGLGCKWVLQVDGIQTGTSGKGQKTASGRLATIGVKQTKKKESNHLSAGEEVQLRVYDKLWENIIHKENRLWTFLAIYGAAVGFIVSQDLKQLNEFRYPAYLVLLLLTYWAAEIVIDSDWWSVRNRLMIRGIEQQHQSALRGVIPSVYNAVGYRGESLHAATLIVVCIVGLATYFITMEAIFSAKEKPSPSYWAVAIYAFGAFAVVRCLHVRERRLRDYYSTLRDLNVQRPTLEEKDIRAPETGDYGRIAWRVWALLLYVGFTAEVTWRTWNAMDEMIRGMFLTTQLAMLGLFLLQWHDLQAVRPGCAGFRLVTSQRKDESDRRVLMYIYRNRTMIALFVVTEVLLALAIAEMRR
jgi:hypothetical protein